MLGGEVTTSDGRLCPRGRSFPSHLGNRAPHDGAEEVGPYDLVIEPKKEKLLSEHFAGSPVGREKASGRSRGSLRDGTVLSYLPVRFHSFSRFQRSETTLGSALVDNGESPWEIRKHRSRGRHTKKPPEYYFLSFPPRPSPSAAWCTTSPGSSRSSRRYRPAV